MSLEDERDVIAGLAEKLGRIAQATSDPYEAQVAFANVRQLELRISSELEALVRAVRDELEHYKGCYNDSFDQTDTLHALRSDARVAAKRAVNYFVGKRRPDLDFVGR